MNWSFVVRGRDFFSFQHYIGLRFKQDKVLHSVLYVGHKLLAVAAAAAAGGGGDVTVGRACFTAGLHSWRTSHKLNTKFPF